MSCLPELRSLELLISVRLASDHVTVDVTRLIRSWFGSDVSRVRDAVEGFQSLRTLNADEQRLMKVLDATTVLLSPVTWLRRRMDSGSTADCAG